MSCVDSDSSTCVPLRYLPEDLVLQIITKIIDLKTLCVCKLVSKRFSSMVVQVETLSVTAPHESWLFENKSMWGFTRLKSLYIHLPFINTDENTCLFKWVTHFTTNKLDWLVLLSPGSVYNNTTGDAKTNLLLNEDEEKEDDMRSSTKDKATVALRSLYNVSFRFIEMAQTVGLPFLDCVLLTDWGKSGSVCFNRVGEMFRAMEQIRLKGVDGLNLKMERFNWASSCFIPLLELPVSGYTMRRVSMGLLERDDLPNNSLFTSFIDIVDKKDGIERDKEEAAYREAITEIFKNRRESLRRVPWYNYQV